MLVVAGALLRCAPLAVLALRRVARLASHPATTAKLHTLFLHGAKQPYFYLVQHGDTLSRIIHAVYGIRFGSTAYAYAEAHLCYLNSLKNPNHIRAGQTLIVTPLPQIDTLSQMFRQPTDILLLPSLAENKGAAPRLNVALPASAIPATKDERDMLWALSWIQESSNWLTVPGSMLADATGRVLHEGNLALLREVQALYAKFKAGVITENQYAYRRRLALQQFSRRVGPLERLMFGGRTSREAIRIARGGGIPATQNIMRYASRLGAISKAARLGAPVILTGVSLAAGCGQIAATKNRVEKNEIFWETGVSSLVGLGLGVFFVSNPVGWGVALAVVAGSAATSYGAGKAARFAYDKYFQRFDLVSKWDIDRVCR